MADTGCDGDTLRHLHIGIRVRVEVAGIYCLWGKRERSEGAGLEAIASIVAESRGEVDGPSFVQVS